MLSVDLHTHSRFFHAAPEVGSRYDPHGVKMALWFATRRAVDGIAITNHDFFRRDTMVSDACIPGIEMSTTRGHLLVVGESPPERTVPGDLSPEEAVEIAHEHGCAAIVAHPLRNSSLLETEATFDAIEVNGKHPEHRQHIQGLAESHELPIVGGSDAHFPFEVGRVSTEIDVTKLTADVIVTAIKNGHVSPVFHQGPFLKSLGAIYTGIHKRRGQLGSWEPPDGK